MTARGSTGRLAVWLICWTVAQLAVSSTARAQTGTLQQWRDAVRNDDDSGDSSSAEAPRPNPRRDYDDYDHHDYNHDQDDDYEDSLTKALAKMAFWGVTSPWWVPPSVLGDSYGQTAYFTRFPYDGVPGYLAINSIPRDTHRLAARFDAEYSSDFGNLTRLGGRLLLESSMRLGLDAEAYQFEERLPGGRRDRLDYGDCNVVFRFAQSERMMWRSGIGFNWLDDELDTNFGFNATYGADWYIAKPWVATANIDWGRIDRASLLRLRTTIGVTFHGLDAFTGYEYFNLGGSGVNLFLSGLRIRF